MAVTTLLRSLLTDRRQFPALLGLILLGEALLGLLIINKVAYTEIDWVAYMQEVGEKDGYLSGQRDYSQMRGDTGPLVYPAGFVYIYAGLYQLTDAGSNILLAQYLFLGLYLAFQALVMVVYHQIRVAPQWAVLLLCLSKRVHSIFMLRLFNDPVCMVFLFLAVLAFMRDRWSLGCLLYSVSVGVKMNTLLFAPVLLVLLWKRFGGLAGTLPRLAICASVQLALGWPFLRSFPLEYFQGAFDFGRQFFYVWTVNLRFLPEHLFLHPWVARGLLLAHVALLVLLLDRFERYRTREARLAVASTSSKGNNPGRKPSAGSQGEVRQAGAGLLKLFSRFSFAGERLPPAVIAMYLFAGNFVGIVFARSLHYQFYVWYFHSLPLLLWASPRLPTWLKLAMLAGIEYCWNVFPSTTLSSGLLWGLHLLLLGVLLLDAPAISSACHALRRTTGPRRPAAAPLKQD